MSSSTSIGSSWSCWPATCRALDELFKRLEGRAINIHHWFLPSFKGARPYHQAFDRGVKLVGATAHYVAPLNEGPIIEQKSSGSTTPSAPTSWSRVGRDAECLALADAVQWHCERLVLLNGHRRRLPLTYADPATPESRSESMRFPWPTGRSRSWISAGGWVASTAVNGSRILYVCRACRGTTQALPGSSRTIWPSLCSSARPEIT